MTVKCSLGRNDGVPDRREPDPCRRTRGAAGDRNRVKRAIVIPFSVGEIRRRAAPDLIRRTVGPRAANLI